MSYLDTSHTNASNKNKKIKRIIEVTLALLVLIAGAAYAVPKFIHEVDETKASEYPAFAIYSDDDHSLNFYRREEIPVQGAVFEGKIVTDVYVDFERNYLVDWYSRRDDIGSVAFIDKIAPISTLHWFANFTNCKSFDLKNLDTSNVTNMSSMFNGCSSIEELDLSNFNTSNVENMSYMFCGVSKMKQFELSSFDTSKVTDMKYMFSHCSSIEEFDLSNFNTSNVADMTGMFSYSSKIKQLDLSSFDTSNVVTMQNMFRDLESIENIILSSFDTSNVTNMEAMFFNCSILEYLNISNFNTMNVTNMGWLFGNCKKLKQIDVSNFNTEHVENMSGMFYSCACINTIDVSNFNTEHVENMSSMFSYCSSLHQLDLNNFNTKNVVYMSNMFESCAELESLDLSNFDTSNVIYMDRMFLGCENLTNLILDNFDTRQVVTMIQMFYNCKKLKTLDLSSFITPNVLSMNNMFNNMEQLSKLNIENFDTKNVQNMNSMFGRCFSIKSLNLNHFKADNLEDAGFMFYGCIQLEELLLDNFQTTDSFTNMQAMFFRCCALKQLDLKNLNTKNIARMDLVFSSCTSLEKLDISNFNTSNVINMASMFSGCRLQNLDLSHFDTSNVTDMNNMFASCYVLENLDLSNFDTSNVTNMSHMFHSVGLKTINLSMFDTQNVTDMSGMFSFSSLEVLDLTNFDTTNVTDMSCMFVSSQELATIYASESWQVSTQCNTMNMFGNSKLTGGLGSKISGYWEMRDGQYAHIDYGADNEGYFTPKIKIEYQLSPQEQVLYAYGIEAIAVPSITDFAGWSTINGADKAEFEIGDYITYNPATPYDNIILYPVHGESTAFAVYSEDDHSLNFYKRQVRKPRPGEKFEGKVATEIYTGFETETYYAYYSDLEPIGRYISTPWGRRKCDINSVTVVDEGISPLSTAHWFQECAYCENMDLFKLNTSRVTNMDYMFDSCYSIETLDVSNFDTSNVTSMESMFNMTPNTFFGGIEPRIISLDLSAWNTSNVINMRYMFRHLPFVSYAIDFDTSSVETMHGMFSDCLDLQTLDITAFNTSNCKDMSSMFHNCRSLSELDVSYFNTSNVENMDNMFSQCCALTVIDLSNFDTSSCTSMNRMFACSSMKTIYVSETWTIESVINGADIFYYNTQLIGGLGSQACDANYGVDFAKIDGGPESPGFLTPKTTVTTKDNSDTTISENLYIYGIKTPSPLEEYVGWATEKHALKAEFCEGDIITYNPQTPFVDIQLYPAQSFDTLNFHAQEGYFSQLGENEKVNTLNTAQVMFKKAVSHTSNIDDDGNIIQNEYGNYRNDSDVITVAGAKRLRVTVTYQTESTSCDWLCIFDNDDFHSGYDYDASISGQLGNTTKQTKTFEIEGDTVQFYFRSDGSACSFYGYYAIVEALDDDTTTMKVFGGEYLQPQCSEKKFLGWALSPNGTQKDIINWKTVTGNADLYAVYKDLDLITFAVFSSEDSSLDFYKRKVEMPKIGETFEGKNVKAIYTGFETEEYPYCQAPWSGVAFNILSVSFVDENIAPISTENWFLNFWYCTDFDLEKLDTSNVASMAHMFESCYSIEDLDVTTFNTHNVTNMNSMFCNASNLIAPPISDFDTSNVTDMANMFSYCSAINELNLSSWNVSNVSDMNNMFCGCSALQSIDFGENFDTSNVFDMSCMFYCCDSLLELDLSSFNTSNLFLVNDMFEMCWSLNHVDVSNFDTSNVSDFTYMFCACPSLTTLDLSSFDTSNAQYMSGMIAGDDMLETLDISNFDTRNVEHADMMFAYDYSLKTIYAGENFELPEYAVSDEMFAECNELVGGHGTTYDFDVIDGEYANIDNHNFEPGYFTPKIQIQYDDGEVIDYVYGIEAKEAQSPIARVFAAAFPNVGEGQFQGWATSSDSTSPKFKPSDIILYDETAPFEHIALYRVMNNPSEPLSLPITGGVGITILLVIGACFVIVGLIWIRRAPWMRQR